MRPIEFNGSIGRTSEVTPLKQAEDSRPQTEQQNLMRMEDQRLQDESHQVTEQENAERNEFDAKHGGKGSYEEQKNKKRKKEIEEKGIVTIKSPARFDIKI